MAIRSAPLPDPEIETLLRTPVAEIALADIAHHWRTVRLTFIYERPPDLETGPRLPAVIRGALGNQLARISATAEIGTPAASAFAGLFADHSGFIPKHHFPKPFVIWAEANAASIWVEISLFGSAAMWRRAIADAMLGVMRPHSEGGEGGVCLAGGSRARRAWKLTNAYWRERDGYPIPPPKPVFVLASMTPLVLGNAKALKGSYHVLFVSLCLRIAGLAAWHRLGLTELTDLDGVRALCREIVTAPILPPKQTGFARRSRSFGRHEKFEAGIHACLRISDYPAKLWPCFVLGTLCHIGFDVSQGAGRYEITDP